MADKVAALPRPARPGEVEDKLLLLMDRKNGVYANGFHCLSLMLSMPFLDVFDAFPLTFLMPFLWFPLPFTVCNTGCAALPFL